MPDEPRERSAAATSHRDKRRHSSYLGIGVVLLSALLIALAPNAAKVAYKEAANPLAVITFRAVIGALAVALYLSLRRQWMRGWLAALKRGAIPGLAQVLTALGFLGAVAYIDVSIAALIFYFHPFIIAAVGHFRGDMPMSAVRLACIGAAIVGLSLVFGVNFSSLDPLGVALSFLGMVAITVLIFTVSDLSNTVGAIPANFIMTVWSIVYLLGVTLAGMYWPSGGDLGLPVSTTGWIAILATGITTTTGYILFFVAAQMIGTTRAAVWTITEPVFAILIAILVLGELLTPLQWAGVAIVIASLVRFETA